MANQDEGGVTRRGFLVGSSVALTSALAAGCGQGSSESATASGEAAAPSAAVSAAMARLIDVHHHFLPPYYQQLAKELGGRPQDWTPQVSLDKMNATGLATAMLSISNWVAGAKEPSESQLRTLCRECNNYGAQLAADHPGRFGLFASVMTLPDVDVSLREVEYALDSLKADGVGMMSHYGRGRYLGDPAFAPLYEELNRRKVVVFVHPTTPWYEFRWDPTQKNPIEYVGSGISELPFDTTRGIISLLGAGVPEKYPDIKWIFSHMGGTLPFLSSRVGLLGSRTEGFATSGYQKVAAAMSGFYYDLTNTVREPAVKAVLAVAPASHLLFGTDIPRGEGDASVGDGNQFLVEMKAELPRVGLTDADLIAAARGNAETLFPRFKQTT